MDKDKVILAAVIKAIGERFEGGWRVFLTDEIVNSIGAKDGIHFLGGDRFEEEPGEWIIYLPEDCVMRIPGTQLHASHMIGDRTLLHLEADNDYIVNLTKKEDNVDQKL